MSLKGLFLLINIFSFVLVMAQQEELISFFLNSISLITKGVSSTSIGIFS